MLTTSLVLALSLVLPAPGPLSTPAALESSADGLAADYATLAADIDACPDGNCMTATTLLATQDQLDAQLAQLHADRNAIPNCNCSSLDTKLGSLDGTSTVLRGITEPWEDQTQPRQEPVATEA
ncbi:MAG: hypothetical protein AAF533_18950 [Acidobacteriota bacterium]